MLSVKNKNMMIKKQPKVNKRKKCSIAIRNKVSADFNAGLLIKPSLSVKPKIITSSNQPLQIPLKQFTGGPSSVKRIISSDLEELLLVIVIGVGVAFIANEIDEYLENQKLNKV